MNKTNDIRKIARGIRVGDDIRQVDARLGGSKYGWSSVGTTPMQHGSMYGGSFDNLHQDFDSLIRRVLGGEPSWYRNVITQQKGDWPVIVKYDDHWRVTAVYIDGTRIILAASQ